MISRYKRCPNRSAPMAAVDTEPEPDNCVRHAVILCAETVMDTVMYVRRKSMVVIHYLMGYAPDKDV